MGGFANNFFNALGQLIKQSIRSPNFVSGVSGWAVFKDGSAEFNNATFRGTVVISSATQSILIYNGTPAAGNLIFSIAPVGGTDAYGNSYLQGAAGYTNQGTITSANSIATRSTQFASLAGPLLTLSPDLNTWNAGEVRATSGNLTLTAPQLKLDVGNGVHLDLVPASPAGAGNAAFNGTADTYVFAATNDTVKITLNGAVQVDPAGTGLGTHAFIAGTIGSGSVNWYRGSANRWKTDDGVDIVGTLTLGASDTELQRDAAHVVGINGAFVGHGETWHTPSYNANWSTSTTFNGLTGLQGLQYRQDAEDNLWLNGCFKAGGTLPGAAVFALPVGWRPANTGMVTCYRQNGGVVTAGLALVNNAGNVDLFAGGNMGIAINNEYYLAGKIPLGNIS